LNALGNQKKNTEPEPGPVSKVSTVGGAGSDDTSLPERESYALKLMPLLPIVFIVAIVDQAVKAIVVRRLYLGESITVLPGFLTITRIHNSGIAFGLFPGMPDLFMVVTLISMLAVLYFYLTVTPRGVALTVGCALIMGGALGNLIDRFRMGYVVDYIYFSFWPAFNVADSSVTIGVALLIISFFFIEKGTEPDASDTV
jgi:signal peptidase II